MSAGTDLSPRVPRAPGASWWNEIARRARESDVQRQIRYDRSRKAVVRGYLESHARRAMAPLVREYLETLFGAAVAFWLIGLLLGLAHARPLYTYLGFGLFYSVQAAYHTYRLRRDPDYRIPKCRCAGARHDGSDVVLRSDQGMLAGLPKALLAAGMYLAVGALVIAGQGRGAAVTAGLAVLVSAYLARVMVWRIRALCAACISMAALNLLILWQLLR